MNIAENTADTAQQAANVVQADVQNQVTQSVTTLDHLKDFLLNHGPDVIYAIVIFIVGRYVARAFKNLAVRMMTSDAMRSTVWRMSPSLKKHSNCQRIWILLNISRIASASSTTRILRCKRWYSKWMHSKATISATFLSIPHKRKRSAQMNILSLNTI